MGLLGKEKRLIAINVNKARFALLRYLLFQY